MEPRTTEAPAHLSRPEAIGLLREKLASLTDTEHCVCAVAQRLGLPCQGFAQLSDAEFKKRFSLIASKHPGASREEMNELVNLYLLGRQEATHVPLACDVETREHDLCGGWNTFDNTTLEKVFGNVFGREVKIG
ncbi:MAG: hypothetical protein ACM3NW_12595 [Syntrophomonadaceae bacterium]